MSERQSSLRNQASSLVDSTDFKIGSVARQCSVQRPECSAIDKTWDDRLQASLPADVAIASSANVVHFFYPPVVPDVVWPSSAEGVVNRPRRLRTVCAAGP